MSRAGRGVVVLVALLGLLLAGAPVAAAADRGAVPNADSVLVVGVPGLTWRDVDPASTPELWALAEESPIGAMSVRAARSTTCVLDGWATLGAGNRARFPGPDNGLTPVPLPTVPLPGEEPGVDPGEGDPGVEPGDDDEPPLRLNTSLSHCGLQERIAQVALGDPEETVARTAADEGTARFGAEPGALGAAVGCATVRGRAATLAVAAPDVEVSPAARLPEAPDALVELLGRCPLTLVSLDQLAEAGAPGMEQTEDGTEPLPRAVALAEIDAALGRLQAAVASLPGETLLLLQGISEVNDGRAQLHAALASGPGFDSAGWLTSASTGRAPFVQLIDVAPTALQALGLEVPASMNGQPLRVTDDRPPLAEAVEELREINTAATVHHRNTTLFFWTFVTVGAVLVALGVLVLGGWHRRRPGDGPRGALRTLAVAAAALPVATYLAGLVPWERAEDPVPALVAAVLGADLAVLLIAVLGPWRRHRVGPPLAVLGVTFATLVLDVLTGSTLELNAPLGYDAVVAGRFTGYGNLSFGLLSVSALLLTTAVTTALARRAGPDRSRAVVIGAVLALGLGTVAVIGAPGLGRDFGGVLAALPGFLVLAMLLGRIRVTVVRLLAVLALAVVAVGSLAFLDWLRTPAERSHLGRFVEQVLTGEAWTVISRKAQANLDILLGSPLAWMLPVALVAAVWLLRPGGLLRSRSDGTTPGGLPVGDVTALRAGLLACLLSLALGAAVNDSGVALPATAAAVLVPLLVWLAAGPRSVGTGTGRAADGTPPAGPAEEPDRVTVVSRGSSVWNA